MANTLNNSTAEIIGQMLVDLGICSDSNQSNWQLYIGNEEDNPDNCITVYDTSSLDQGYLMIDGSKQGPNGVQIRIRGINRKTSYQKSDEIFTALSKNIKAGAYDRTIRIGDNSYKFRSISSISNVISLGKETNTNRYLHTINTQVNLKAI